MSENIEKEVTEVEEEIKAEEPTQEAESKPANIYYLNKEDDTSFIETVEEERKGLYKLYKNISRRNNIIMVAVVAIFIASFILITQGTWGQITGWVLVGTSVVGMVIYHILTRNTYPRASKKYFNTFWTKSNEYIFQDNAFKNCYIDWTEKYQLADVASDRVYKEVIDTASRNIVHGEYKDRHFVYGELAFYKEGARKHSREVIFVGRHIALSNSLALSEGRYLINMRGEKGLDLPNDIEDLVELIHEDNFIVYGLEGSNPEKALGKSFLSKIRKIKVTGALVNVNIVLWSGRTAAYLSYDDQIAAIPFHSPIQGEAYKQLKNDVEDIFEILTEL